MPSTPAFADAKRTGMHLPGRSTAACESFSMCNSASQKRTRLPRRMQVQACRRARAVACYMLVRKAPECAGRALRPCCRSSSRRVPPSTAPLQPPLTLASLRKRVPMRPRCVRHNRGAAPSQEALAVLRVPLQLPPQPGGGRRRAANTRVRHSALRPAPARAMPLPCPSAASAGDSRLWRHAAGPAVKRPVRECCTTAYCAEQALGVSRQRVCSCVHPLTLRGS